MLGDPLFLYLYHFALLKWNTVDAIAFKHYLLRMEKKIMVWVNPLEFEILKMMYHLARKHLNQILVYINIGI